MARQGQYERIDQEEYREQNAEQLERSAEKRIADFVDKLEHTSVDINLEKVAEGEEARHVKHANAGLKAILARAAAADAKAHEGR